ncbi:MAG TPA: PAS domain S-box protein [Mycobacterium sp.]|nr:PAS domain S-box protein [Mycobacterium sp.]
MRLPWQLVRPKTPSLRLGIAVAAFFIVVESLVVGLINVLTNHATGGVGTIYLLGVVVVSALWGFGLAMTTSVASAIAFLYVRNWPGGGFVVLGLQSELVIAVFVVIALVASALAGLARMGERFFDLSSDLLCITSPDRVIRVNPAFTRILGYSRDELESRPYTGLIVPEDQARVRAALEQLADSTEPVRLENRVICRDGSRRWIEWSIVWHRGLHYAVGRDVTERRREQDALHQAQAAVEASRDELSVVVEQQAALAEQQTALRRVTMAIAQGASPSEVFAAVAEEMAQCLHVENASVMRYESGNAAVVLAVAALGPRTEVLTEAVGTRLTLDGDNTAMMTLHTGRPARMESFENATGSLAEAVRGMGLCSGVSVPIVVGGRVWGTAGAGSARPMPPGIEARMADFADLVATSIANAATRDELIATRDELIAARDELIASRARIVAAADDARRRLERDLHDGAQQRLVTLRLQARMAEAAAPAELDVLRSQLSDLASGLNVVSTELQEISRGIHPAILSEGGLAPALRTLARRCPIPANIDVLVEGRLREPIEVAAYYVVAEALTNAAKYSRASEVQVCAEINDDDLCLSIQDNGIGGADSHKGSGLIGLKDRVEVLGGHMHIVSPPESGTSLRVTIPLTG